MAQHFSDERWVDYVRGVLPAPEAAALRHHLEEDCKDCRQSFRLWRTVSEVANGEVRSEVPEDYLRLSQDAYRAWRQRYWLPSRAIMARLVFDSLFAPLPAGVRGEIHGHRRIMGRAGQWSFDLSFEPSAGKRMDLVGQILRSEPHGGLAGLLVLLMSSDNVLDTSEVNEFGEFQLQFVLADNLQIYFDIPGNRPIRMSLPDLGSPSRATEPD